MRETLRVLVVEDNQGDVDLIREALSETRFVNFQIDSVSRLSEALARLKTTGIDLILLDLGLPDSKGLETFRRLLEAKPHIPVIILTGNDDQRTATLAVKEGAQDYLIKGLPWGRLLVQSALYAIERKQRESRERLVREVLDLLNRPVSTMDTIHDILQLIKNGTGFEAVGIRLKEGNDFPYHATNGFSEDFVQAESRLCAYDEAGKIVCDDQGNPVLECMCGNIIYRRTDASLPFFTASGSFWTNSTTELLASTTEEDRQSRTRNRCHGEGYESVALIPLQTGDEIIGLLQLNDHRRKRFTLEMIHFFEGLGASIGIALTRKRTMEALRSSEERLSDVIFSIADWVWEVDENGVYTYSSQKGFDFFGETRGNIIGKTPFDFMPPEEAQRVAAIFSEIVANKTPIRDLENWNIRKNGEKICLLTNGVPILDEEGNLKGYRGIDMDITERKRAEREVRVLLESVQQEKTRLSSLVNSITDEVWFADSQKKFTLANPSALRQFCIDPDQTIDVESLAKSLIVLRPDGSVRPVEEAPPLRALLGEVVMNQEEIVKIPASGEFRYRQVNAAPVRDLSGNIIGSVSVVRDITEKKRGEKQLQDTLESLRKAVSTTIQVMVSTVEARDPYTAGHQTRSADLARAIATELGLPQDKIDGIRMAGSIHDIGKISIPAEIMSKPTKLTEIEFSLIKEHARRGFEMLKDVESPWPLAEIVYQHHERMDGSGYPRNLKGEEICMEARILTVADVVEAMASHRPYRPGLGIEVALNEIEKNRGIFYDNAVADACLRLFREKGFKLEGS